MEVEFERSLHNNYMVIKNAEDIDGEEKLFKGYYENYQIRMLSGAGVEGFLLIKLRYFNGREEFCYDISSKQKLSDWFKTKKLDYLSLHRLLESLCKALENAVDYMLEVNHIILKPDYIFADIEKYEIYLSYCPFYEADIMKSGQEFLQYLLEILDYSDKAAVEAGYEVFRLCMKDGFRIDILKQFLEEETSVEQEDEKCAEVWNRVIPVNVMKEEIEDECEKPIIPYIKPELRKKICVVSLVSEVFLSLILVPLLKTFAVARLVYAVLSIMLIGLALAVGMFYSKIERLTRIVTVTGRVTYTKGDEEYVCNTVWEKEDADIERTKEKYEETVLLAYGEKEQRLHRLHYIGTRAQEDIILIKYPFTVGKSQQDTDYCLSYPFVSRMHFRIWQEEDKYFITDTNSRNGILVNDVCLNATETKELKVGDRIEIGDLLFLFQ